MTHRKFTLRALVIAGAFWCALASSANASPITYTYTGNPFTIIDAPYTCPPQCRISGSVTFSQPLVANLDSMATFAPLSYSFTDGLITLTQNNADVGSAFDYFKTNASGMIIGWDIVLFSKNNQALTTTTLGTPIDLSLDGNTFGDGLNFDSPGKWTSSAAATVPEPETLLLLSTGCVGLVGQMVRGRRIRKS